MTRPKNILEPNWILILAFFVSGLFFGAIVIYIFLGSQQPNLVRIRSSNPNFLYINPLLGIDVVQNTSLFTNQTLNLKISALLNKYQDNKLISSASIYFRNINSGNWVGINENDKFSPGKLLKIPIMIAYFKLAETQPEILNKELEVKPNEIDKSADLAPHIITLKANERYTADELIYKMIVNTNDTAANVLFDNIDSEILNEVFSDLGVDFKEDKENQDFISLKLYSLFFRVLYNATYLNRVFSEKALTLLVAGPNDIGLGGSLPKELPIANLVGGHTLLNSAGEKIFELFDCGITYYDDNNYDLCAVSRGKSIKENLNFLAALGLTVYQEIKTEH